MISARQQLDLVGGYPATEVSVLPSVIVSRYIETWVLEGYAIRGSLLIWVLISCC